MTHVLLQMAEDFFLANDPNAAYHMAKTALQFDPFYGGPETVDRYVAAYRVHTAALCKNPAGEINWYEILSIHDPSAPIQDIHSLFCRTYKLIDPQLHSSAAAKDARKLLGQALEVVSDTESRIAFHKRWNWPLDFQEASATTNKDASTAPASVSQEEKQPRSTSCSTAEPLTRRQESARKLETSVRHKPCNLPSVHPAMNKDASRVSEPVRKQQQHQDARWRGNMESYARDRMNTRSTAPLTKEGSRIATNEYVRKQQQQHQEERWSRKMESYARDRMNTRSTAPVTKEGSRVATTEYVRKQQQQQHQDARWRGNMESYARDHMITRSTAPLTKEGCCPLKPCSAVRFKKQGIRRLSFNVR